jgi:DNA-binding response OmpR family regulator
MMGQRDRGDQGMFSESRGADARHGSQASAQSSDQRAQAAARRILIVEDEMALAMLLEDAIAEAGHKPRKAARLSKAMELARGERFDAAVLDVNLNNEPVFPLAALLRERGVPFLFASGYGSAGVPPEYSNYPVLQKPYGLDVFHAALRSLLQGARSGTPR